MVTATFKSNNRAIQFLSVLERVGIHGELVALENQNGSMGCSYGVRFAKKYLTAARQAASRARVMPEKWI